MPMIVSSFDPSCQEFQKWRSVPSPLPFHLETAHATVGPKTPGPSTTWSVVGVADNARIAGTRFLSFYVMQRRPLAYSIQYASSFDCERLRQFEVGEKLKRREISTKMMYFRSNLLDYLVKLL